MLSNSKYLFLIILIIVASASVSQRVRPSDNYNREERIFTYINKPGYLPGEVIWFKVYAARLPDNQPSDLSNAVYAELSDGKNVIFHSKIMLEKGLCSGAFEIPDDAPSGEYVLKTFTSFMKNTALGMYDEKRIVVVNTEHPMNIPVPTTAARTAVQDLDINISTDKPAYTSREKIAVDVSVEDGNHAVSATNISVSVYKIDSTISEDNSIAVQVQNAYAISAVLYAPARPFYGIAEERYQLDSYTRFNTMEEVFREYVKGVGMGISNKRHRLFIYDELTRQAFPENPFIILDGVPANNIQKLLEVDPMKIKTIDVVTRKYYFGDKVFYGIIDLKSYNGDMAGYEPDESDTASSGYEGVRPQRVFDNPVYTTPQQKNSRHPDFRAALYWQPNLLINGNGRRQVQFYSSDLKGTFRVVVNGIANGKMGSASCDFTVK